jgi:hypothetical protein
VQAPRRNGAGGTLEGGGCFESTDTRRLSASHRRPPAAGGASPSYGKAARQTPAGLDNGRGENQLRHCHLRLRLVPRQTDQPMRDGLVTERE